MHSVTTATTPLEDPHQATASQRTVLQLMLHRARNAQYAQRHLEDDYFPDSRMRACFAAFRDLPLPDDPLLPVDPVAWAREAQRLLQRSGQTCSVYDLTLLVPPEDVPVISVERAVDYLHTAVDALRLGDAGAWLQAASGDLGTDPYEAASEAIGMLQLVKARGEERAQNVFALGGTLADLAERKPMAPPWLIGGCLHQEALAFLFGQPNVGKTWVALDIARSVASRTAFFGLTTSTVPVCAVLLETPDWSLYQRVQAMGGGDWLHGVHVVTPTSLRRSSLDLTRRADLQGLIAWVRGVEAGLVILDPLNSLYGLGEQDSAEVKPILKALDELRHETGAAVLVLHHERKGRVDGQDGSDLDSMRGSSALAAAADAAVRLKRERGATVLRFAKVRAARTPDPIWLTRTDAGPFVATDEPEDAHEGKEERIETTRTVLRTADGGLSSTEVTERLHALGHDVSQDTVRNRYLPALMENHEIEKRGAGKNTRYWWRGNGSVHAIGRTE